MNQRNPSKFFSLSGKEHVGVLLLLGITVVIAIIPRWIYSTRKPLSIQFSQDSVQISNLMQLEKRREDSLRKHYYSQKNRQSFPAIDWLKLGFSAAEAIRLNSSMRGKKFESFSEISKVSGIDSNRLKTALRTKTEFGWKESKQPFYSAQNPLELNLADSLALISLKGIGPATARKILSYRKRLGGFHHVNQLLEIYKIDTATIQTLQTSFVVDAKQITKIKIEASQRVRLESHPYLTFKQVKSLLAYVQQHGKMDQKAFMQHPALPLDSKTKLLPYLEF